MGCLQSRRPIDHPNVFRVVNLDEHGMELWSGKLEVTENDLILYREGRDSTVWPLHSLRRYGFENEVFSFESGRRCETGEGIYAFRCRRAMILFKTLQNQIQLKNSLTEPYLASRMSPSPHGRQTLQASVVHRSSIDHGLPDNTVVHNNNVPNPATQAIARPVNRNPRSVSSADILEVMPLYPHSQTSDTNHVTNVYQFRDFKREHNNNHSEPGSNPRHEYCNDLSRDLAILRNTLRQETAINTMRDIEDETRFLEGRYISDNFNSNNGVILSPTLSSSSEHYAQLSIEQQQQQQDTFRLYMNIAPPDKSATGSEFSPKDAIPLTPITSKPVEYSNLNMGTRPEVINSYANLSLGDLADSVKNANQKLQSVPEHAQKYSESDTYTSMSPVEELEVNYAILDIDSNKEPVKMTRDLVSPESQSYNSSKNESTASCSSHARPRLVSQSSAEKPAAGAGAAAGAVAAPVTIGYTTIDFDKTVALTSVASGTDVDSDGQRKTRHNSNNVTCGSPTTSDKIKA